ncbi:MAG: Haloacid dehalogenase-like hydrolase [Candidatus Eremiobacteraeota bacterium]|nr:Haloacid dehalogenase-like hydrolase [Candidatus Eremiobacteraeota bacterium]
MPAFYFDVGGVIVANVPAAETFEDLVVPETLSIIERLLERGEKVGLATAFSRPWVEQLVASTPVLRDVTICCASDAGAAKPARAFFAGAQQLIGSNDIVFVDDQEENVQAARAFGWTAFFADDGWQTRFAERYLSET